jgi:NADPH2:quinone reductase
VQLAAASGARMTAQVSLPERRNDARQLDAHQAVVSLDESSARLFHLVQDAAGGLQLIRVIHGLAPGATVVLYGNRGGGTDDLRLGTSIS